ncbi:MAG TPA: glycoside hydrolase family 2 TIM barrel-domain containing protein [Rhizomicrobium sp.]
MLQKHNVFRLAVATFLAILLLPAHARETLPVDQGWRFIRSDVAQGQSVSIDDSGWRKVSLPHSVNAADGDDGGNDYYRGPVWYRRHIDLKPPKEKRVFLEFGAATLVADVYVNGRRAGRHEGGFSTFRFDVTALLQDGENLIAVRVDNAPDKGVAPLGGDFTVFGGLIRPVKLILTGPTHIDVLDDGGPGVYVSTVDIQRDVAELAVETRIANDSDVSVTSILRLHIRDAKGGVAAEAALPVTLKARETRVFRQTVRLKRPHLWDGVRDPYLYRVTADIAGDAVSVPLGVRTYRVDPAKGFILNGKPYDLHGVNYFHVQRPGRGPAVGDKEIDQDYRLMRELGSSGIRMAHFQHPARSYDNADRYGFVTWTEIALNTAYDPSPEFLANVRQQMRELAVQTFNHPAVVFLGLGNELRASDEASNRLLATAQEVAKTTDPARLTAYAHCCLADDDPLTKHADLLAYNRYWGLYQGPDTLEDVGPWADRLRAAFPDRPIGVSEYGGCASIAQQEDPPSRPKPKNTWHPEQYQTKFHEAYWTQFKSRPYLWAKFVWQMFDTASDERSDDIRPGINDKGLVTYDRAVKKDAFFWYKANWSKAPFVYITSRRFSPWKVPQADVKIFTNLTRVTLWLNGVLVGTQNPDGRIALWRGVVLKPGDNVVIVRGRKDGASFEDRVVWRLEP